MRAFVHAMQRFRSDKELSKKVLSKYLRTADEQILEASWKDVAPNLSRVPKPSTNAIQFIIDGQFKDKNPLPKPESFVDTSIIEALERNGFVDSVYR